MMNIHNFISDWYGVIIGVLLTTSMLLLSSLFQPWQIVSGLMTFYFCGFFAGLFTKGSIKDGCLAGILCVFIINFGLTTETFLFNLFQGHFNPLWELFPLVAALVILIPINALTGILGIVVRKRIIKLPPFNHFGPAHSDLFTWGLGILFAGLMVGNSLNILRLNLTTIFLFPVIGGFVSGLISPGGWKNGAISGALAWMLGVGCLLFFTMGVIQIHGGSSDFTLGLGLGIIFTGAIYSLILLIITGIIGGECRRRFFVSS